MASDDRFSAWRTAINGWFLAIYVACRMPRLFASSVLAMVAIDLIFGQVGSHPGHGLGNHQLLQSGGTQLVWASGAIAVHRFVLLSEQADRFVWQRPSQLWHFFIALMPFQAVGFGFGLLKIGGAFGITAKLAGLVLLIVGCLYVLRSLLMLPAIAVDSSGGNWPAVLQNARQDSIGQIGRLSRVLFAWLMLPLPLVLGLPIVTSLVFGLHVTGNPFSVWLLFQTVILEVVTVAWLWALAASASQMLALMGRRLTQAPIAH